MTRKDKKSTHKLFYLCACLLLTSNSLNAQVHSVYLPENKWLALAEEQFAQEQYRSAMQSADAYLQQSTSATDPRQHYETDKAGYYSAVAALKLNIVHCEEKAVQYIKQTANPVYKQRSAYTLAQFYFEKQMLDEAIEYYELSGVTNLNNKEVINAKFELAYCYFNRGRFAEAEPLLASVHQLDGKYFNAGNYYYGLLAYNQNKYAEALESFKAIEHHRDYTAIVPYYIAEIYYFTGNKDKALKDALRLIRRPEKSFYHNELHLLTAQIYFEAKDYKEALPYFEFYYDHTDRIRKEDLYEMAYTYYRLNDWENAIENFKQLSDTRDSLGQSSMYLLGDCYLKISDKKSARNAFSICADMPFNQKQKEAALFLAAKLSYELGYNVDAIYNINILLADFPGSAHHNEAKTLLSELLIRTHNYAEAHKALQDVTDNSDAYHRVYQKVAYSYALQQMQLGNTSFADSLLSQSLKHTADNTYTAAAQFWKSELAYKAGRFDDALTYGRTFIDKNRSSQWVEYLSPNATERNAYTTMGYASMKLAHFTEAQEFFNRAKSSYAPYTDSAFIVSSTLREADAVFMQKDYKKAIELYDAVIASGYSDTDYAYFQKATILGLEGEYKKKENILSQLINNVQPSRYANAARYELGLTFIEQNKYTAAINIMMPLTEAYDIRNMAPKAWMKIGFAYQQARKPAQAIDAYKKIAIEYPTSEERPAALDALKSLYIQSGQPEAYAQLLKDNNLGESEENSLDSTYYATAEMQYTEGNFDEAINLLGNYLQKYPNGVFVTKAHYYKAESHYNQKQYALALQGYKAVLESSWSNFSEKSARRAANISFELGDYSSAIGYYNQLRNIAMNEESLQQAYNGLMSASYMQSDYAQAASYADTLLSLPQLEQGIKDNATLYKARSLNIQGDMEGALAAFKQIENTQHPAISSEARYSIAEIHFKSGRMPEAEKAANNTIQLSGGDERWIVKSYILLADILTQQEDYFNAKATLQSIVKNCKIPELKKEAEGKLKTVKKLENKKSKLTEE